MKLKFRTTLPPHAAGRSAMKIWDLHCHPNAAGDSPARRMETILKYADRMGVERLCGYMGRPWDHHPAPELLQRVDHDLRDNLRRLLLPILTAKGVRV